MDWTWLGPPLDTRPLFPVERAALLDLLGDLDAADWHRPTVCPGWDVHDIAAHLLHDYLRRLSGGRDGHPGAAFAPGETLPAFLARTNEDFVRTARQLSPRVLTELLGQLGPQLDAFWATADPDAPAGLDVWWAAPGEPAPNWLDLAREFTEFWVHQQQIRDAVGHPGAQTPPLLRAVLDTFLRGLPHTLRGVAAPPGTVVAVTVTGEAGGHWTATRRDTRWALTTPSGQPPAAELVTDPDTLWRLATRGITPAEAATRTTRHGDETLTTAALQLLSVIR